MSRVLVATLHDADRRLHAQSARLLPWLRARYAGIYVVATPTTSADTLALLEEYEVQLRLQSSDAPQGLPWLGRSRRDALAFGVESAADWLHFCDWDRILHWAQYHGDELQRVLDLLDRAECSVHGRTAQAFASHPRVQRDTEAIVNHVFGLVSGQPWDVTAVSRGFSLAAATFVATTSTDDSVGSDASWLLLLLRDGRFPLRYAEVEGLAFETADRFADQVMAAGGLSDWLAALDADPQQWELRTRIALLEVQAALAFTY